MKIQKVTETGTHNILMWAINAGADIKSEPQLQAIINDDLCYEVEYSDVNFFELFRLTQTYREKLRIVNSTQASIPTRKELMNAFNVDLYDDKDELICKGYEAAETAIESFINLTLQMKTDDDIINPSSLRLFLPMISRKFIVQIPVSFVDIVTSLGEGEDAKLFNSNYPNSLNMISTEETPELIRVLELLFYKVTTVINYSPKYDQYLNIVKFSPLPTQETSPTLYQIGLVGWHKYDPVSHGERRFVLFNSKKESIESGIKMIKSINSPLYVDFAVRLPIEYMQVLQNIYSDDELHISYNSSISTIISDGIRFNDFTFPYHDEDDVEGNQNDLNRIDGYRTRIAECNQATLNTISLLSKNKENVDQTLQFSLLPSLYTSRCIISINYNNIEAYIGKINDEIIDFMFKEMIILARKIFK